MSAPVLLDVWERGHRLPPARQALLLLEGAGEPWEEAARLPVGERDGRILTLRAWTFGDELTASTACPACGALLEMELPVEALRAGGAEAGDGELEVEAEGYAVRFRLPTGGDVVAALASGPGGAIDLLGRCVRSAERGGDGVAAADLPPSVVAAVGRRMEAADPQSRVTLALSCELCGHSWESLFDIVTFFWAEIERWAQRTMRDVHALASAYGWTEGEILGMSAWRRSAYLNLARG